MQFPFVKGSFTTTKRAPCNRTLREIWCLPFSKKFWKFWLKIKWNMYSQGAYHLSEQTGGKTDE